MASRPVSGASKKDALCVVCVCGCRKGIVDVDFSKV